MAVRMIFSVLLSVVLCSCATSIRKVQIVAPPVGSKSKALSIPHRWVATWETIPQGETLYMWVNKAGPRILFEFGEDYHSLGDNVQNLQFGSTTCEDKFVSVILWPPSALAQLNEEMRQRTASIQPTSQRALP